MRGYLIPAVASAMLLAGIFCLWMFQRTSPQLSGMIQFRDCRVQHCARPYMIILSDGTVEQWI